MAPVSTDPSQHGNSFTIGRIGVCKTLNISALAVATPPLHHTVKRCPYRSRLLLPHTARLGAESLSLRCQAGRPDKLMRRDDRRVLPKQGPVPHGHTATSELPHFLQHLHFVTTQRNVKYNGAYSGVQQSRQRALISRRWRLDSAPRALHWQEYGGAASRASSGHRSTINEIATRR